MNPPLHDSANLSRLPMSGSVSSLGEMVQGRAPGIVRLLRPILHRKWQILLVAITLGIGGYFLAASMTPIYRSTVSLLIESSKANVVSIQEVYSGAVGNREHFQTQAEFLRSRDVAFRVVRDLNLMTHPRFDLRQQTGSSTPSFLSRFSSPTPEAPTQEQIEAFAVSAVRDALEVEPQRLTEIIKVSFDSPDRQLAAEVANQVADSYIQADLDARDQMTQAATTWLHGRLAELKVKLESSEDTLQAYRESQGLISSPTAAQGGNARQLEELSRRLVDARVRLTAAQDAYNQIAMGGAKARSASIVLTNPMVARSMQVEADADKKVAEMADRFGPAHPLFQAAANEQRVAKEQYQQVVSTVVDSIGKEYQAAKAALKSLETAIELSRGSLQEINRKEIDMGPIEREVNANRELYERFLTRVKETDVAGDIRRAPARIVDPAVPSLQPIRPSKGRFALIFAAVGFVLAAGLATVVDRLRHTLRTGADVEGQLGYGLLAAVPTMRRNQGKRSGVVMLDDPASNVAEAVRTIGTSTMLAMSRSPRKVIVVTSPISGEGKSTIACNLALFFARTRRVLLIDADLRKPSLVEKLQLEAGLKGLGEFLVEDAPMGECLSKVNRTSLRVMPAGNVKMNALEMLLGPKFGQLIETASNHFDVIIVDSAPVELVSDALIICAEAPATIMVTRSDKTPVPVVRNAIKRLEGAGARILGVVLNGHDFSKAERYYGDYAGYSGPSDGRAYGA